MFLTEATRRDNTTTPLQALVTLNDPQFVEAARMFAERIAMQRGDDEAKLRWGFVQCVARPPNEKELGVLAAALQRERERYGKDATAARALLAVGEAPRNETLPLAEHAAWAQVATTLLNLSETLTRN